MTVLVFGLDGLDYHYVQDRGLLSTLDVQHLQQDFTGPNALYTGRVWPSIFAGEDGYEAEDDKFRFYEPDAPFVWEQFPATVLLAPVRVNNYSQHTDAFPERYAEGLTPPGHVDATFDRFEEGLEAAFEANVPLVVAVTRLPDIVGHHADEVGDPHALIQRATTFAERWCDAADDYMVVSDHGFGEFGTRGVAGHTRDAVVASSFCEYDTMTGLIDGWLDDLAAVLRDNRLAALGYT